MLCLFVCNLCSFLGVLFDGFYLFSSCSLLRFCVFFFSLSFIWKDIIDKILVWLILWWQKLHNEKNILCSIQRIRYSSSQRVHEWVWKHFWKKHEFTGSFIFCLFSSQPCNKSFVHNSQNYSWEAYKTSDLLRTQMSSKYSTDSCFLPHYCT